ncbi:MAG TPA: TatD family hydrolase [Candidatus Paceibacterota bacterium]
MTYFDSHSHLNFPQYDDDREEAIARMREAGVGTICVGTSLETSKSSVALAEAHEDIWASVGVHPTDTDELFDQGALKELLKSSKTVAIGECGLDYFHKPYDESKQRDLLVDHLGLAKESNLPLIIHCREAYDAFLSVLREQKITAIKGVMHFFAGTEEQARDLLGRGFYLSFAGPVTFAAEYDRVIQMTPMDRLLIETDAPFAAPSPYRGKRNEPAYVVGVAKKIATVKGISLEKVASATTQNARELFKI